MIWVAWRQFRTAAARHARPARPRSPCSCSSTGLHLRDVYELARRRALSSARDDCSGADADDKPLADLLGPRAAGGPGAARDVLGRAAGRARARERDLPPRVDTRRVTRRRWLSVRVALVGVAALAVAGARELARQLVVRAARRRQHEPHRPERLHRARGRRDRLRGRSRSRSASQPGALTRRTLPAMAGRHCSASSAARVAVHTLGPAASPQRPRKSWFPRRSGTASGSSRARGASASPRARRLVPDPERVDDLGRGRRSRPPRRRAPHRCTTLLVRACPAIAAGLPQNHRRCRQTPGRAGGFVLACEQRLAHQVQQLVTYRHRATTGRCRRSRRGFSSAPRCS